MVLLETGIYGIYVACSWNRIKPELREQYCVATLLQFKQI